jgi:hypothetical protein
MRIVFAFLLRPNSTVPLPATLIIFARSVPRV